MSKNNKTPEMKSGVAYGSIYLDAGEDTEKMTKKQIDSFRKYPVHFVFFDIICKKSQILEALAARGYVQQEALMELGLTIPTVYVAISFDDSKRPARDAMMEFAEAKVE